ncbi:3'(2'),5'-bisphosphate nucleotidase CysQ [Amylibacter sp. IMCC11727]|uniref:3'(2'),5'-bisphosphate nucleotidase CysQ n=1 Tax=Amylibacter sp. IMCC11727 TaxID=3039851 RepID=UPI00244E44F1|nr:3'(2'),5'-bisphosphate nucleotidase CysQ [Amylibacter sp. IMCC11727]WGI22268.1 3'(2'),5'-bisphosphate nucleotidase CysQ [Amylibacter sp. IMCC11727]
MPAHDLDLLLDAAKAAGDIALKHFKNDPEVWEKDDDQGPVTVADLAINRMLEAELQAARPDYGWLSEETEDSAARLGKERVFILDPIDGTRAFIMGHENFAHSFAVAQNGVVTAAVVHMPAKEMTFAATRGGGATMNGAPITPSDVAELAQAEILAAKPMMDAGYWAGGVPPVKRNFRSSLAYRLCLVAKGQFDAMITFRPAWEWDVAAGDLICTEAGACVFDAKGETPVYNSPAAKIPGMIACPSQLKAPFLAHLVV